MKELLETIASEILAYILVGLFSILIFYEGIYIFFQIKYYTFRKINFIMQHDKVHYYPMRLDK